MLVGGTYEPGQGAPFEVVDPATGEPYAEVVGASDGQVDRAVEAAADAFPAWRKTPQAERSGALRAMADAVEGAKERLADVATHETGRPRAKNLGYVAWTAEVLRFYAELARGDGGRMVPGNADRQLSLVERVPYGVVAALAPFNYPMALLAQKVAPALAAGNTVVVKPAPETTMTTLLLAELWNKLLPRGVLSVLAGGAEVGQRLVTNQQTALVAFTGSTSTGRQIAAACAPQLTPTHLELGGKDPAIVCADIDPRVAAHGVAWAAFLNAGQVCTSTERAYVHRDVADAFIEELVEVAKGLRVGDPFDPATQIGPMRTAASRDRVLTQIEGTVLTGGTLPHDRGFFLAPTVITDVPTNSPLLCEESFAPVLPVVVVDDDDEALALAAQGDYGLGASIYTHDARRVGRALDALRVGTLWVNDPVVENIGAPFGGLRGSGNARELGLEGLHAFTATRHISWALELQERPWWFRHSHLAS